MESLVIYSWAAIILWIGIYQSLLLAPVFWWRKKGNRLANRLLSVFVLVMGFRLGVTILEFSGGADKAPYFLPTGALVVLFYSPLFYFYIKALIERDFRFGKQHFIHLGPILLLIGSHKWIFHQHPEFSKSALDMARSGHAVPKEMLIIGGMLLIIFLGYLFLTGWLLVRYRRYVRATSSFSDVVHYRWVLFLAGVMLLPLISVLLTMSILGRPSWVPYPAFGVSLMVVIIGIVALVRPEVLNGIPDSLRVNEEEDLSPQRYVSSTLTDPQKLRIQTQLLAYMEQETPFLTQELTLHELATQLDLNAKYLSQVINEVQGQNFMDFINGYRIRRAQEMLLNPAYQHITILAVAQDAGFKSKSSFYNAFKKVTGMTPSAFKNKSKKT